MANNSLHIESKVKIKYFVPPAFVALFGFLVYFTLFGSFSRERDPMKVLPGNLNKEWLYSLYSIWKIVVFSFTIWFVNSKAHFTWKNNLFIGCLMTLVAAGLLFFFSYNNNLNSAPSMFFVDGVSAIGEGLLSAGIVTYVRGYSSNDDFSYSNLTAFLRIGQNCGMVASLFMCKKLWEYLPNAYPALLMLCPFTILALSVYFKRIAKGMPPIVCKIENVKLKMNARLMMNIIVGACASGLFYLIAFGPMVLFGKEETYKSSTTLEINGLFSVASMVVILIIFYLIRTKYGFKLSFEKMVLQTKIALILMVMFWMLSLMLAYSDHSMVYLIYITGGVLGLFSTSSYLFGELNSGIKGKKELQTKQVLAYLGFARIGPMISLIIIAVCRFFIDLKLMENWFAVLLIEFIVLLAITGIYYTIKVEQKQTKTQLI
jgi:hypothetical protein